MHFVYFKMYFETKTEYVVQQFLPLKFVFPDKNKCIFNLCLWGKQEYADSVFLCISASLQQLCYDDGQRKSHTQC